MITGGITALRSASKALAFLKKFGTAEDAIRGPGKGLESLEGKIPEKTWTALSSLLEGLHTPVKGSKSTYSGAWKGKEASPIQTPSKQRNSAIDESVNVFFEDDMTKNFKDQDIVMMSDDFLYREGLGGYQYKSYDPNRLDKARVTGSKLNKFMRNVKKRGEKEHPKHGLRVGTNIKDEAVERYQKGLDVLKKPGVRRDAEAQAQLKAEKEYYGGYKGTTEEGAAAAKKGSVKKGTLKLTEQLKAVFPFYQKLLKLPKYQNNPIAALKAAATQAKYAFPKGIKIPIGGEIQKRYTASPDHMTNILTHGSPAGFVKPRSTKWGVEDGVLFDYVAWPEGRGKQATRWDEVIRVGKTKHADKVSINPDSDNYVLQHIIDGKYDGVKKPELELFKLSQRPHESKVHKSFEMIPEGGEISNPIMREKFEPTTRIQHTIDKLPDSPKKKQIIALYDRIKQKLKGTKTELEADHFVELQTGGRGEPLNFSLELVGAHRGPGAKGVFQSKSNFVEWMDIHNSAIVDAWNIGDASIKNAIRNRTHPTVVAKDKMFNNLFRTEEGLEKGVPFRFDAKFPGRWLKDSSQPEGIIFVRDQIDPQLRKVLEMNNAYYGKGKRAFKQFDNAEDHLLNELITIDENIPFYGDEYETLRKGYQETVKERNLKLPKRERIATSHLGTAMFGQNKGGLINGHLTDTIPPKRGPMPQGLPLLDPLESVERSRRQHFVSGGFANLFGKLSKVPRAVGRFGDIIKTKIKPTKVGELAVSQAQEDKPAMFLSTVNAIEDAPDSARLTSDEWLRYVKRQSGISETELDEFGLEQMLNNLTKEAHKGSPEKIKAIDDATVIATEMKKSGSAVEKNFSDLMRAHQGDMKHPDVIDAKRIRDEFKLNLKKANDDVTRLTKDLSENILLTPKYTKRHIASMYQREMPKIDMDIAVSEPVERGAGDLAQMMIGVREKGGYGHHDEKMLADIFSSDPRLLDELRQPPQDATGMKVREKIINIMKGTNKHVDTGKIDKDTGEPIIQTFSLLKPDGRRHGEFNQSPQHFKELWTSAFKNIYHSTNQIVKDGHRDVLSKLVDPQHVMELAAKRKIPPEQAFEELYQALNIFDRSITTADTPIPFWTKKLLYRLGDMGEGRGFFYKSKGRPEHGGETTAAQFIPGGSGYGELKFYQNFDEKALRAQEPIYDKGHFGGQVFQGNTGNSPFGWLRFSERIDEHGRKLLLGEEIQSDLHQNVAQKGYAYAPRLDRHNVIAEMGDIAGQLSNKEQALESTKLHIEQIKNMVRADREKPVNVNTLKNLEKAKKKQMKEVKVLKDKLAEQEKKTGKTGQVHPDTAFKKSENYAKVFMQGLMKLAHDKGYDGVALSTGRMKKRHGNIPKGGDKFYDEIGVSAMKRIAKKSGFRFSDTTIVDGDGNAWEKIPVIEMRDINTGVDIPGTSTVPVYKKGGFIKKNVVRGYNGY